LDDVIRPEGDRHFALLGRATGLIKINGRRFRLESVENALRGTFPDVDMVCVPVRDDVRAEHYELFCDGDVPQGDIAARLAAASLPVPRAVRRVAAIPRGTNGKVQLHRLLAIGGAR
jgi:acyl-coenzyme A synthetase/AMP-(fatty) acid ligase